MYIIIGGCGRLGSTIAELFSVEGNDVVVIDKEEKAFNRLTNEFTGTEVVGDFSDQKTLEKAGAKKSNSVVGATDDDNANVIGCQIAKEAFDVEKTVARINDPQHEKSYDTFNIDSLIIPSKEVLSSFKNAVYAGDYSTKLVIGENAVEFLEVKVGKEGIGKVKDLDVPEGFTLSVIRKDGGAKLVDEEDEIEEGDRLYFLAEVNELRKNKDWFKKWH